jgi:hypothetical protein
MTSRPEQRGSYRGTAELWTLGNGPEDAEKVADVDVVLTAIVNVVHIKTIGIDTWQDNTVEWGGTVVSGRNAGDLHRLLGTRLELLLPSGRTGQVALRDAHGTLSGVRWPPFLITYDGVEVNNETEAPT